MPPGVSPQPCHQVFHLNSLGFNNVINQPIDFYAAIKKGSVPEYDVLVTNPPYSEDHIPKLLDYVSQSDKPYLLLMPNYVCTMPYYNHPEMMYWVPSQRCLSGCVCDWS